MTMPLHTPMRLREQREPFSDPGWLFEVKQDGVRALAYVQHSHCELQLRHGHVFSWFAPLSLVLAQAIAVDAAILDGETVCIDPTEGR